MEDIDSCKEKFYCNTLLEIDINTHKLKNITHGVNIKYVTSFNSDILNGVVALSNTNELYSFLPTKVNNSGRYLLTPLTKSWLSPISGINDVYKQKTLKKINVQSKGDIILTIFHDEHESVFYIYGSNKPISLQTNLKLNSFQFKIQSVSTICDIKNLHFEFFNVEGRL